MNRQEKIQFVFFLIIDSDVEFDLDIFALVCRISMIVLRVLKESLLYYYIRVGFNISLFLIVTRYIIMATLYLDVELNHK